MRTPGWLRRASHWPLYGLMAAAYPVVFLYGQNVEQAVAPYEWLVPLAISLAAAAVSMWPVWLFVEPGRKSGI